MSLVKKWWVVAAVFTLALSLTSCGAKNSGNLYGGAYSPCQGPNWSFYVQLNPSGNGYELDLYLSQLVNENSIIQVALDEGQNYSVRVSQDVLSSNQIGSSSPTISIPISATDVYQYSEIIIAPKNAGLNIDQESDAETTYCQIPTPGYSNSN